MERRATMAKPLPPRADFEQLRKQAKDLAKAHGIGDPSVCATLRHHHRFTNSTDADILTASISLQEVQHALARGYGFGNWAELKQHIGAARAAPVKLPITDAAKHISDQILVRARDRGLFFLDSGSIAALALWSLIRWERKVALSVLDRMGIDLGQLADGLDSFLAQVARENPRPGAEGAPRPSGRGGQMAYFEAEPLLNAFLDRASFEARQLEHDYVGSEHLLLAVLRALEGEPSSLREGVLPPYESVREAIVEFLGEGQ